jgi:hypothetical protein
MEQNAWIISANMGLGHQRATYPLRHLAYDDIQLFGENQMTQRNEKKLWRTFQGSYEFISRTRQFPLIGPTLFNILDVLQSITPYYPRRDQSRPSLQVRSLYSLISRGLGGGMGRKLNSAELPVITSSMLRRLQRNN